MPELLLTLVTFVLLVAVKVGGYAIALRVGVPLLFPGAAPRALLVAGVRTLLGAIGAGVLLGLATLTANLASGVGDGAMLGVAVAFGGQVLFRAFAWCVLLVGFYDRRLERPGRVAAGVVLGLMLSTLLDVPEVLLAWADLAFVFRDFRMC